jgi:hypothetical protein
MAVVSPVKMNVLYIGLDNPLAISVPGVPADKLVLSADAGSSITGANGDYSIRVKQPGNLTVKVAAKIDGSVKEMGTSNFRVKHVPKPEVRLGDLQSSKVKPEKIKTYLSLTTFLDDFVYDVRYEILSFQFTYAPKNNSLIIKSGIGAKLTTDMTKLLNMAKNGDVYYFDEIQVKGPGGEIFKINNITYKII